MMLTLGTCTHRQIQVALKVFKVRNDLAPNYEPLYVYEALYVRQRFTNYISLFQEPQARIQDQLERAGGELL